jgi:hypothetical protein
MATLSSGAESGRHRRSAAQTAAWIAGAALLLLGILGFIPGSTVRSSELRFGPDSGALLFGVFQVSVLQNLVFVVLGGVGSYLAVNDSAARSYLFVSGLLFWALWVYGIMVVSAPEANVLSINPAGNLLHLGLGFGLMGLGLLARKDRHRN